MYVVFFFVCGCFYVGGRFSVCGCFYIGLGVMNAGVSKLASVYLNVDVSM